MLRELNEFGFTNLTGIDYSESSIQLAKQICAEFDCTLKQQDILQMNKVSYGLIREGPRRLQVQWWHPNYIA